MTVFVLISPDTSLCLLLAVTWDRLVLDAARVLQMAWIKDWAEWEEVLTSCSATKIHLDPKTMTKVMIRTGGLMIRMEDLMIRTGVLMIRMEDLMIRTAVLMMRTAVLMIRTGVLMVKIMEVNVVPMDLWEDREGDPKVGVVGLEGEGRLQGAEEGEEELAKALQEEAEEDHAGKAFLTEPGVLIY